MYSYYFLLFFSLKNVTFVIFATLKEACIEDLLILVNNETNIDSKTGGKGGKALCPLLSSAPGNMEDRLRRQKIQDVSPKIHKRLEAKA